MVHDDQCERTSYKGRETCGCAERAYSRDPMLDENGRPIRLGSAWGTMAGWGTTEQEP